MPPSDPQGEVLNRARELARDHLRHGRDFIWNATNLSRNVRGDCVRLFHGYDAHVRHRVRGDDAGTPVRPEPAARRKVPEKVIERLLDRWEVPDRTEAHQVEYVVG